MSLRRSIGGLALALSVATFTGCDEITGNGDEATIIVENNTSVSVFYMYISECGDDEWGNDELGSSETISPGEDREFDVEAGCWDLRAEFSDETFAEDFGIDLDEGDEFTWELVD